MGNAECCAGKGNPSDGPVDISSIPRLATDDFGLMDQPPMPKYKICLVQVYVRDQQFGGPDKCSNGHRYDSIPFANGMISVGMSCQLVHYRHEEHDEFFRAMEKFDAVIVRCLPGQIKADGGSPQKFDAGMRLLRKSGIQIWPSPDVTERMCAKDALVRIAGLGIGLKDTYCYYNAQEFAKGFKRSIAYQPRVIKQNRGSGGEGIWIAKLKSGDYCAVLGSRSCLDEEDLVLTEASDNHEEEHTISEFIEFCVNGRSAKAGTWSTTGIGKYFEGGKEAGGFLVDQRFFPRVVEGSLRYHLIGEALVGITKRKPRDGQVSAVEGAGSVCTNFGPSEEKFANLTSGFLKGDLQKIMPALGLPNEPIPLWWTVDFMNSSPEGTQAEYEKWIVTGFDCACVSVDRCLAARGAGKSGGSFADIPLEDKQESRRMGCMMGKAAKDILDARLGD